MSHLETRTGDGSSQCRLTNRTGAVSVKGTVVETSDAYDLAVKACGADEIDAIGVIMESGVADGDEVWVATSGIAQVLLEDGTAATRNYWVRTSTTQAGRADATTAAPPGAVLTHFGEVGHSLQNVAAGTDQLCWIAMHFL